MRKTGNQVIACGACAVIVEETGETTTSVDMLIGGIKHLFAKTKRQETSRRAAAAQL